MDAFSTYLSNTFRWRSEAAPTYKIPETVTEKEAFEKIRVQLDLVDQNDDTNTVSQLCTVYLSKNLETGFYDVQKKYELLDLALDYLKNHHLKAAQVIWVACLSEHNDSLALFPSIANFQPQLFINALHEIGKNGHEVAPYHLGILFLEGKCVEQNSKTAQNYLKVSATRGFLPAIEALKTYFPKPLIEQAFKAEKQEGMDKALPLFEKAAASGDKNAMYRLGKWYLNTNDTVQAKVHFKNAMLHGHEDAQLRLGNIYAKWYKDAFFLNAALLEKAKKCYKEGRTGKHAERSKFLYLSLLVEEEGDKKAQFLLGKLYLKGLPWVKPEVAQETGKKHITAAAEAGHAGAAYFLFIQYEMGLLTPSSPTCDVKMLAMRYYNLAAENGHPIARLEKEVDTTPDPHQAMKLYYQHSTGDMQKSYPPDSKKAHKYLLIAAERGNEKALKSVIFLGRMNAISMPRPLADYQQKLALIQRSTAQSAARKNWLQDERLELAVNNQSAPEISPKPWQDHDYL